MTNNSMSSSQSSNRGAKACSEAVELDPLIQRAYLKWKNARDERKFSSLLARDWKEHWAGVLLGAVCVVGGIVFFVKGDHFGGSLLLFMGVTVLIQDDAGAR